MPQSLPTNYLAFLPLVSRTGADARVLPVSGIDFVVDGVWTLDLTATVQSAQLRHTVQSMFVDASQVPFGNTIIQVSGTGQRIVMPPLCQGYFPLLLTMTSFVFTFINGNNQSPGSGVTAAPMPVYFMNVPFVTQLWTTDTAASGGYGIGPLGGNPLGQ